MPEYPPISGIPLDAISSNFLQQTIKGPVTAIARLLLLHSC
jgi:hypothetical protein